MTFETMTAAEHVDHLLALTERLTERLLVEIAAFKAQRPQDTQETGPETVRLCMIYRQESARIAANPTVLAAASKEKRLRLIEATKTFDEVLARHGRTLKAAKTITEGLIRTLAQAVAVRRNAQPGYGPTAMTRLGDASALTYNARA